MRDYYDEFVLVKSANSPGGEPTKPTKDPSARFVGSLPSEYSKNLTDSDPGGLPESYGPGHEIFEERVAIMMYDGGLSEAEAVSFLNGDQP